MILLFRVRSELTRFSKGKDYTYLYGKHVGTGSLTPYIDGAFDPRVDEYVLNLIWFFGVTEILA